jgi:hypothetical protein
LKPEWWGIPLAQEEKYQGRKKPVTRNDDDDDDDDNNNNNNNNYYYYSVNQHTYNSKKDQSDSS